MITADKYVEVFQEQSLESLCDLTLVLAPFQKPGDTSPLPIRATWMFLARLLAALHPADVLRSVTLVFDDTATFGDLGSADELSAVERALQRFSALRAVTIRAHRGGFSAEQRGCFEGLLPTLHERGVVRF